MSGPPRYALAKHPHTPPSLTANTAPLTHSCINTLSSGPKPRCGCLWVELIPVLGWVAGPVCVTGRTPCSILRCLRVQRGHTGAVWRQPILWPVKQSRDKTQGQACEQALGGGWGGEAGRYGGLGQAGRPVCHWPKCQWLVPPGPLLYVTASHAPHAATHTPAFHCFTKKIKLLA